MSVLEWKKFNLFNLVPYVEHNKLRFIKADITSHCQNVTQKIFCDASGYVHVFRSWTECISFQAHYTAIQLCAVTTGENLLVTLTQQNEAMVATNSIHLQVFNLQKITKKNGAPCIGYARLSCPGAVTVLRAHLLHDGQLCIAIGFERGDLQLHRAPIGRGDMSGNFRSYTVSMRTITGIEFWQRNIDLLGGTPSAVDCNMFICSNAGIFCYTISENNDIGESKVVLDSTQVPTRCCTMYTVSGCADESYFIVGRDDALYCFTNDGRGPCYALDGRKNIIFSFGNNLVVVGMQSDLSSPQITPSTLVVIDIYNKMIVLQKKVNDIANVLCVENGLYTNNRNNCFILTKSRELLVLRERDMQTKLRLLVNKNLFDIALRLLDNNNFAIHNSSISGKIYLRYGNYLLLKGDISGAVDKYIKTIGAVEPYCVIRKLLDSRYNRHLAEYLGALTQTEHATSEHFELLFNCTERLALPTRIKRDGICVKTPTAGGRRLELIPGVYETQINAFLELLRDTDREHILKFFSCFGGEEKIFDFFAEHGQMLMRHYPQETTETLKCIYDTKLIQSPNRLIPLLMINNDYCVNFVEHTTCKNPLDSQYVESVYNFLFESYLRAWQRGNKPTEELLQFLRLHAAHLCAAHVFILSRTYAFWAGVVHMYELSALYHLSMRYFIKSGCFLKALACRGDNICFNLCLQHLWIHVIHKQTGTVTDKIEDLMCDRSVRLINQLLNATLQRKRHSLLQLVQSVSRDKRLCVLHIKDFFLQAHLQQTVGSSLSQQIEVFQKLHAELQLLIALLENFCSNPIEFRSSICDICRRQLNLPAVFFLCQHSYHKECMSDYASNDNECVACMGQRKQKSVLDQQHQRTNIKDSAETHFDNIIHSSNGDIIKAIASLLGYGILNNFKHTSRNTYMSNSAPAEKIKVDSDHKHWSGRFKVEKNSFNNTEHFSKQIHSVTLSKNPFEEYDANLNPFGDDTNPLSDDLN